MNLINQGWASFLNIFTTMPPWLAAFLVGWFVSIGLTQTMKFTMPLTWSSELRNSIGRMLSVLAGAIPAGIYYANVTDPSPAGMILVMLSTGLWSPIAYRLLIGFLRKRPSLEWAADALSGDKRGVIIAKLRGEE